MIIAVLGLGIIGSCWTRHLRADGFEVRAWNRTPGTSIPGAVVDACDAVRGADLVLIAVSDPPAVDAVIQRVLPVLTPGAVVGQHSTVGHADTMRYAAMVREAGGRFLDMPFTGSKPAAESRQVFFFVGDDDGVIDGVAPVYRRIAKGLHLVGGVGAATSLKLAMNLNLALMAQALSESMELAHRAGISRELFYNMMEQGVGRSGLSDLKRVKWLTGDYAPQFSAKNMGKDLKLAKELAREVGMTLPLMDAVLPVYAAAFAAGLGADDFTGLVRLLQPESEAK
jgi:3-hydroxyisobutyrate dehydrogenase-like beta-hydroxyacid dehydrogenase